MATTRWLALCLGAALAGCLAQHALAQGTLAMFPQCLEKAIEFEEFLERHPYCKNALKAAIRCPLTDIEVEACAKVMKEKVIDAMETCEQEVDTNIDYKFLWRRGGPCKFGEKLDLHKFGEPA